MRSKYFIFLFLLFSVISCQTSLKDLPPEFDTAKIGTTDYDVTYCETTRVPLKMDIYYPSLIKKQWPVVVSVHGGSWMIGDKSSLSFIDVDKMRRAGILLVSVNYRLAPQYKFPAMIEDVKCAVRYLRAHANKYNLDTDRFGAIGTSAGGHLVTLLGVTEQSAGFDTGEYMDFSSRVKAVVSISGLSDLTPPFTTKLFFDRMAIFGTYKQRDPIFRKASPIEYITPDDPPFLIIHGKLDPTVPINQSAILYEQLQETGVPAEFIKVKNADHAYKAVGEDPISPTIEDIMAEIMNFWKEYLMK